MLRALLKIMPAAALALAFMPGPLSAYRLVEKRSWILEADSGVKLSVVNVHGSVEVRGWDREVVEVSAEIRVRAASGNKAAGIYEGIFFDIAREEGNLSVRADVPRYRKDSLSGEGNTAVWIDYSIMVPRESDLDISSVTGSIEVGEVSGRFRVISERGSIEMRSSTGEGILETGSGDITCGLDGLSPGGILRMKTGNGDLSLRIPSGTSAKVAGDTGRGRVRFKTGMISLEKDERRSKRGLLGAGDGEIKLETGTGDVTIEGY